MICATSSQMEVLAGCKDMNPNDAQLFGQRDNFTCDKRHVKICVMIHHVHLYPGVLCLEA